MEKNLAQAIKWFELAATQNHTKAQFQLGIIYLYGENSIEANPVYALSYLRSAANGDYAEAQYELGNYYATDEAQSVNYAEAVKWYRAAANQQHVRAMVELGKIFNEGRGGITPQRDEAKRLLALAAEFGNPDAMHYLRDIVRHGSAAPGNETSTSEFQAKLDDASAGHIPSQYAVGLAYLKGIGVKADMELAAKWLRRAAMNDHSEAQYLLSQLYRDGVGIAKDARRALEWLKIAASAGVRDAQKELQSMHLGGGSPDTLENSTSQPGQLQPDAPKNAAQDARTMAAVSGRQTAEEAVKSPEKKSDAAPDGSAVPKNSAASAGASKWQASSTSAAEQAVDLDPADPEKQYELARSYLHKDPARAAHWFEQAARQNHIEAQYQLGEMYKHGTGVTASVAKAKFWLSSAAGEGMDKAKISLRDLDEIPVPADSRADTAKVVKTNISIEKIDHSGAAGSSSANTAATSNSDRVGLNQPQKDNIKVQASTGLAGTMEAGNLVNDGSSLIANKKVNHTGFNKTEKHRFEEEINALIQAANNNEPEAQLKLAQMYQNGTGVDRDLMLAVHWYQKAASGGEAEAQFQLGDMYKQGVGVEKNNALAIKWFRRAANQGHEEAKRRMGGCRIC